MKIEFYRSGFLSKWRWRIKAENHKIIGASTQGYHNRKDCEDNFEQVGKAIFNHLYS